MSDIVERAAHREILAQAYETVQGKDGFGGEKIRTGNPHGHITFVDVEIALDAMDRLRANLTRGDSDGAKVTS